MQPLPSSRSLALLLAALAAGAAPAHGARPTAGSLAPDRLKLPSGPSSVRGLAEEPEVDPFYGQIGYAVPIDAPAGYGKLAPSLSLVYSGALGNGPLGIGWSMASARIERSQRLGVPSFTSVDELELTGPVSGRLVSIGAGEYRVEGAGQTVRVRQVGAGFELDAGDGTRYRFGATAAARQDDGGARTLAWLVEEVTNLAGERISYRYEHDQGQVYLRQIAWGPREVYAITLVYAARPDATTSYREGFRVVTARRLEQIHVAAFATERRAYQLGYDDRFAVSRLVRVGSTGVAGAGAWPSLAFDYAAPAQPAVTAVAGVGAWRLNANGTTLVDLDGDGAAELLQLADGGHAYRANTNGAFGPALPLLGNTQSITSLQLMDVDGDARAELVADTGAGWSVWKWSKTRWMPQLAGAIWPGTAGLALKNPATTRFADLNGDGLIDALQWDNDGLKLFTATRAGYAAMREVPRIAGALVPSAAGRFQDTNGDGLDDYVVVRPDGLDVYVGRGDGTFEPGQARAYPFAGTVPNLDDVHLVDLDRDELLDLVRVDLGTVRWYRGQPTGGFASAPVTVASPEPLSADVVVTIGDVNGNGSHDVVWSSASGMWSMDLVGPTTAGMLVRARNGLGLEASFTYRSAHAISVDARSAGAPWQFELPIAMPVPVRKTTALGPGETTRQIDYLVRDGYWDAIERRFGGFLGTVVTTWGATPAQTSVVQTKAHSGAGANRVLRGKPLVEQVFDGTGRRLSITTHSWEAMPIAGLPDAPLTRKAVERETRMRHEDVTPPRETRVAYSYDALGRPSVTVDDGRLDLASDDARRETRYADDDATWVRDRLCEDKLRSASGALVSHTQYLFGDDAAVHPLGVVGKGWPRQTLGYLASEARFIEREATSYDAHGNAIARTAQGVTRHVRYDGDQLFPIEESIEIAPGRSAAWATTWDRVLGLALDLTDPNGHTSRVGYDSLGRFTSLAMDHRPPHLVVQYDTTTPSPRTTVWEFDGAPEDLGPVPAAWTAGAGWRQSVEVANGNGEVRYRAVRRSDSEWILSDYVERDPAGRIVFEGAPVYAAQLEHAARPPGMVGELRRYDPLGRLIEQVRPAGASRTFSYAAFERTTQEGTLAPVRHVFDGHGRVISTARDLPDAHEVAEASYDEAGRLVAMTLGGGSVKRTFQYDTLGRLVASDDSDLGGRTLAWDDADRLVEEANAAGQVVRYGYDAAGRLVSRDGGGQFLYHYDAARPGAAPAGENLVGHVAWIEEPTGVIDLGYDELGRGVLARRAIGDRVAEERTRYTASGLVAQRAYDDGFSLDYGYDAAGRATTISNLWQATSLDAAGRLLGEAFGNGVTASYERDDLGSPSSIALTDGPGRLVFGVKIGRTPWTGIETVRDVDGRGLDHSAAYRYDGFARLIGADLGTGAERSTFGYGYDALHNLVTRTAAGPGASRVFAGSYRYGEAGRGPRQLTSTSDPDTGAVHTFGYDAAGRQVARDGLTLSYDALDRLIQVDGVAGRRAVIHAYGHDGLRVQSTGADGQLDVWFSDAVAERGGRREHEVELDGRVLARVTLAPADAAAASGVVGRVAGWGLIALAVGAALAAARRRRGWRQVGGVGLAGAALAAACSTGPTTAARGGALWAPASTVYQHLGVGPGPAVFTDEAGEVIEERRFEPFGAPIDAALARGGVGAPDLSARDRNALNKRTEPMTGWSDHGARWMASETGGWLTPDPVVQAPSPELMYAPWDLHPYQYVAQNPVAFWDPDGQEKRTTFDEAHIQSMFYWFVTNAAKPRGGPGNTNPALRCSCIGTLNLGIEALYNRKMWGNKTGLARVDLTQSEMERRGLTLGSATVHYRWHAGAPDATRAEPVESAWETVMNLSRGDKGWSVYIVSIAGGYHSVTVSLDNTDPSRPVMVYSDQNPGSGGWKTFEGPSARGNFDAFMKYQALYGGDAYTSPTRAAGPLAHPPLQTRYVRLAPDDE